MINPKKAIVNGKIAQVLNIADTKLGKMYLVLLRGKKAWVKASQVRMLEGGYDEFLLR